MTDHRARRAAMLLTGLCALALLAAACQTVETGAGDSPSPTASAEPMDDATPEPTEEPMDDATPEPTEEPMDADALVAVADSDLGRILTDADGNTLYLFSQDHAGMSMCTGDCAAAWPPLTVSSPDELVTGSDVSGELGTLTRDDGSLQVTINGVPLYYYSADGGPGDTSGHEVGGVWFAVNPQGQRAGAGSSVPDDY